MSLPAITSGDSFCFSRKGGTGGGWWVHRKGADSMAVSGLRFGNTLIWVGHCYPHMHEWVEKTVLLPCTVPISGGEAFIPFWVSGCQLSTMTIASSSMDGCGLSHERVEDGCKSTCMKFGGWKPNKTGDMVSLKWPPQKSNSSGSGLNRHVSRWERSCF